MKSKVKAKAGDAIAQVGQQRPAKVAQDGKKSGEERKSVEMKNTMENIRSVGSQAAVSQELFEPQEWEALLNNFENDSASAAPSAARNEGEIELSSDDLWERLSSTRWLREQTDIDRESTLTQRPTS